MCLTCNRLQSIHVLWIANWGISGRVISTYPALELFALQQSNPTVGSTTFHQTQETNENVKSGTSRETKQIHKTVFSRSTEVSSKPHCNGPCFQVHYLVHFSFCAAISYTLVSRCTAQPIKLPYHMVHELAEMK